MLSCMARVGAQSLVVAMALMAPMLFLLASAVELEGHLPPTPPSSTRQHGDDTGGGVLVEDVGAAGPQAGTGNSSKAAYSNFVNWFPLNAFSDKTPSPGPSPEKEEDTPVNKTIAWYNFPKVPMQFAAGYGAADLHDSWAAKHTAFLNDQPNCTVLIGVDQGDSDGPDHDIPCTACKQNCTRDIHQPPVLTSWDIAPSLKQLNAFDIKTYIVLESISQLRPFSDNGIFHKMEFEIAHSGGGGFWGQTGPMVRGGSPAGDGALEGRHVFHISDTEMPNIDRSYVKGRRLVLPGHTKPGDVGNCVRTCLGCQEEDHPHADLLSLNLSTGVSCIVDNAAIDDGHTFVYQLHMSNPRAVVSFAGTTWVGQEWEARVTDVRAGSHFAIGRVVLESNAEHNGIKHWISKHVHLGCSPCDASYEAWRVIGPFIQKPKKQHTIQSARVSHMPDVGGENCTYRRGVAVGPGYEVLYESGPGVEPVHEEGTVFTCPPV